MATKCITITTDAYDRLASLKSGSESFSEVIKKIVPKHSPFDLIGLLTPKEADELKKDIRESRDRMRERSDKIDKMLQ